VPRGIGDALSPRESSVSRNVSFVPKAAIDRLGRTIPVHFVSTVGLHYLSVGGIKNQDQFGAHRLGGPRRAALAGLTHVKRRFCVVPARLSSPDSNERCFGR